MKDWKHTTQEEVDAMTFEEAVEIVQKQIDMGEKKVGEGGKWCARAHTTHAYQIILDAAKAKGSDTMTVEEQNKELKRLLKEAIKILSDLGCGYDCDNCEYEKYDEQGGTCYGLNYKWKYLDEAEELIGGK